MGYPDNMNWRAYDATIGSVASHAEQVWEDHAAQLNDTVSRAYEQYPLDTTEQSKHRREMLSKAIEKADNALKEFVAISVKDKAQMRMDCAGAFTMDVEHDADAVKQFLGDYMFIYARAIERQGRAA